MLTTSICGGSTKSGVHGNYEVITYHTNNNKVFWQKP